MKFYDFFYGAFNGQTITVFYEYQGLTVMLPF